MHPLTLIWMYIILFYIDKIIYFCIHSSCRRGLLHEASHLFIARNEDCFRVPTFLHLLAELNEIIAVLTEPESRLRGVRVGGELRCLVRWIDHAS